MIYHVKMHKMITEIAVERYSSILTMYLYVRSNCTMLVNPFNKVANYSLLSILRLVKITHQENSQTSMLMLHPIHNWSKRIPIWFCEMLKMRNCRMLCLFQPLVGERYRFCQAGCRIKSF